MRETLHIPFYDPGKSYYENFEQGPFGAFADGEVRGSVGQPQAEFLGCKVHAPFGIAAGPLINGKFVKAALDKGFDIAVYKTVRTREYACNPWPNVLAVRVNGDLTPERAKRTLEADREYRAPLSVTNTFGVPSFNPEFWQEDLAKAVSHAGPGQVVVGSFQATQGGTAEEYLEDFVRGARLVKETGARILEMNLSCPNEGTAALLCYDVPRARRVVEAVKEEIRETPLIVKMAYFEDEAMLREAVQALGPSVAAISAVNTIPAEVQSKAFPGEGRLRSGICGHAIKWAGLDMTRRLKSLREELGMRYSIIGVGGVAAPEDYGEYRAAGADAVMAATGAMWNPYLAQEIKEKLG